MDVARQAQQKRMGGLGGVGDLWMIPAIIVFIVVGITVGPLKGCVPPPPRDDSNKPTQAAISTVDLSPTATVTPALFCDLPGGGRIAVEDVAWMSAGSQIAQYKCEGNGELVKIEP